MSVTVVKQSMSFVSAYSYAPPNVTAVAPYLLNSAGGTVVTLTGSNFGIGSKYSVLFNGADVIKTTYVNSSFVTFTAPASSGLVPVHMVVAGQSSGNVSVVYESSASSLSAASIPSGCNLTVVNSSVAVIFPLSFSGECPTSAP